MTVYVILIAAAVLFLGAVMYLIMRDTTGLTDEEVVRRYQELIIKRERGEL